MKKYCLLLLFTCSNFIFAQSTITFRVYTNNISDSQKVYISGNIESLGKWQPNEVVLIKNENYWERKLVIPAHTNIEFKFTKGSWSSEALDTNNNVPPNFYHTITKDTILNFEIEKWRDDIISSQSTGGITGQVKYHEQMGYKDLLPRDIIVWLPPKYYQNTNERYPVLYMHDGQNLFDPTTSFTGVDWQIDETADSLIKENIITPIIVVGIGNTEDRSAEYGETEKSVMYMEFIVNKLKPIIDNTYRTKPGRDFTAVGGSSSGGLISFLLAWNYSSYFSKAACFSPAFKYGDRDFTTIVSDYNGEKKDITFYINNGGQGVDKILQPGVEVMVTKLQNKGYSLYEDLFVNIVPSAHHNEAAWAKKMHIPLKLFFQKNIDLPSSGKIKTSWEKRTRLSRRFRLQPSLATTLQSSSIDITIPFFVNFNYRNSQLDSADLKKNFTITFSTESGINVFTEEFFLLPYLKIGPELRISNYFYFDLHAGIGVSLPLWGIHPIPFIGSEIGYIIPLNDFYSIEFEAGMNGLSSDFIYYISTALTF